MRTRRASCLAIATVAFASIGLTPTSALARRPTVATDAFYVGMGVSPGVALTGAWDLDVYLTRNRMLSVGPGVSLSVLSAEEPAGQHYDLLVAVDVVRLKVGVNEPGHDIRPFFTVGGGFTYVQLPDDRVTTTGATGAPGEDAVTVTRTLAEDTQFGGLVTFGFGIDLFVDGPWGLTLAGLTRARVSDNARLPEIWMELLMGIRFGL